MQDPYYPNCNAWYPFSSCRSDICQASLDSVLRAQQSKLNACIANGFNRLNHSICNTIYYADNVPYYGLNEDLVIEEPKKKKLTIYDLARLVFPDDPIRDYVEKKVAEIENKYAWADKIYV